MNSYRKRLCSRSKASESTGPKTIQGKAKTSHNARKHGLTSMPGGEDVLAWMQVILGRHELGQIELFSSDPLIEAARVLAQTEVRLVRAESSLNAFEANCERLQDHPNEIEDSAKMLMDFVITGTSSSERVGTAHNLIRYFETQTQLGAFHGGPQHRLLKRYLREAQTGRSRSLKR